MHDLLLPHLLALSLRLRLSVSLHHNRVSCRLVRRVVHHDLPLGALDADRGVSAPVAVDISRDPEVGQCDAVSGV